MFMFSLNKLARKGLSFSSTAMNWPLISWIIDNWIQRNNLHWKLDGYIFYVMDMKTSTLNGTILSKTPCVEVQVIDFYPIVLFVPYPVQSLAGCFSLIPRKVFLRLFCLKTMKLQEIQAISVMVRGIKITIKWSLVKLPLADWFPS